MISTIGYWTLRCVCFLLSLLPLRALYVLSDLMAWTARVVVGYRREVVRRNLRESFPDRDDRWLADVERRFYRFLGDVAVETVKMASISQAVMRRRMKFENVELIEDALKNGRNCSVMLGHYCNWEWVSSLPMWLSDAGVAGQIYHPLENRAFDRLMLHLRGRFGAHSISMADTLPTVLEWRRKGRPSVVGYIADQVPGYHGIHLFVDFLHHDTPVFTGAERISRMLDASMVYARITRPKRGHYICRFEEISADVSDEERFAPTRRYFELLEAQIEECPEYWLWSHRRWKRDRRGFMEYHGKDAERQLRRL